jgi:predicted transcriptional regulator of viral defense system
MKRSQATRLLALARRLGVLRAKDLAAQGIPRVCLTRLQRQGLLQRPSRGVYVLTDADVTAHHSLAEACRRVPHGIVCLISALSFHELTTQIPHEVWLAINRKARMPKVEYPPLRIVRFSDPALPKWVESHVVEGVTVRVTNPARTVVDCFAYRNKVGLDVALEALRDCLRQKTASVDEITRAAASRRMLRVMRPYLEAVL